MTFNIDGIVSGFDTTSIIESLLGFQQRQIDTYNSRKAEVTTKQTIFKGIEAQLVSLQSSLGSLNRAANSVFDARTASSTNEEVISATAGSGAIASNYQLSVEQLATANQIASQGFSSTSETIASGDVTFKVGDRAEQTITVNDSNNTLQGFVNSINEQVDDINASIIFDQAAGEHRILLSSKYTGASNTISVTSSQDGLTGVLPDFSGPAVQPALNAIVKLGSGAGAITAEYDSNTVDGLIEDVTLELNKADPGSIVSINVEADTEAAKEAVDEFVNNFNAIIDFIGEQSSFNPETEQASPLLGDRSASTIRDQLLTIVSESVPGSELARLSEIGIDLNLQGKLEVDSNKLDKALNGELEDVDPNDVRRLFGLNGKSTSSGVRFLGGTGRTQASQNAYEVDITQAAERAQITATNVAAASIVIDGSNDSFEITVDNVASETLTLTQGTYTTEELAEHLQSVVNNSSELGVHDVEVTVGTDNRLLISSVAYGSSAGVASLTGTAATALGFDGSETDNGQDVAGRFIVDGVEEIASGNGRILTGNSDNENTGDLRVEVTLSSAQVVAGSEADLTITQGITGRLNDYIRGVLDSETGLLKTVDDAFQSRIASIDRSIEQVERITESRREYLIDEFTALESIINELQTTGNFISTQLTSLGNFSQNNRSNSN